MRTYVRPSGPSVRPRSTAKLRMREIWISRKCLHRHSTLSILTRDFNIMRAGSRNSETQTPCQEVVSNAVRARNAAIRVYIDTAWSTKLVKAITTLLVELLPCFPAQSPPASDSKTLPCGRLKSLSLTYTSYKAVLLCYVYSCEIKLK